MNITIIVVTLIAILVLIVWHLLRIRNMLLIESEKRIKAESDLSELKHSAFERQLDDKLDLSEDIARLNAVKIKIQQDIYALQDEYKRDKTVYTKLHSQYKYRPYRRTTHG